MLYRRISPEGTILFQRDLSSLLDKTYTAPEGFIAYNGILYVPWSRFIVRDSKTGAEKAFLMRDEPQASTVTADGIYTANYTEATLYFYPFDIFSQEPSAVDMNDPEYFLLADVDEEQCRPRQMDVSADGRYLVVGTGPFYGRFGGAVSVYDLHEDWLLYTHRNVIQDHTILSVRCSAIDNRSGLAWNNRPR